jgi:hypothetical protein
MEERELIKKIAPCGLVCFTCTSAREGVIQSHSQALLNLLEGFDGFAEHFSALQPTLKEYPEFKEVLLLFSGASCDGCREENHCYPDCPISPCVREKGVRFCFECEAFPCDKMRSVRPLGATWLMANRRMKRIGVEAYYEEVKDKSHYAP